MHAYHKQFLKSRSFHFSSYLYENLHFLIVRTSDFFCLVKLGLVFIFQKQKYYIEIAKIPLFNLVIVPTLLECSQKGRKFSMLCVLIYASKIEFRAKNHQSSIIYFDEKMIPSWPLKYLPASVKIILKSQENLF